MQIVQNYEELLNYSKTNPNVLCVVDFYATWCGPCKKLTISLNNWIKMYPSVTFFKIDVDDENHEDTCNIYNISSLPSTLFLKNGEVKNLISGYQEDNIHNNIVIFM